MTYLNPTWFLTKGPEFRLAYTLYFTHFLATILGGTSAIAMIFAGLDYNLLITVICSALWVYSGNVIGFVLLMLRKHT